MARLRNRFTGSEVNVPDEKVENLRARGFDPIEDEGSKAPAKKAASSKSADK